MATTLGLGELAATLTLGQDNAFGQPLESQLRSCVLAMSMAQDLELDPDERAAVYWVALLRYLGCTAHAHEVAAVFGDEIALRAITLLHDSGNLGEVLGDAIAFATAGRDPQESAQIAASLAEGMHDWAVHNFASGCEAGDMLLRRLGFGDRVTGALACTFERWNGAGFPNGVRGEQIPLPMRIVHISHDLEAIARHRSPPVALQTVRERAGSTYDPALAGRFAGRGAAWLELLDKQDPWDAVLELEPHPRRPLSGQSLDDALTVIADFIDLKSPYRGPHSRRCSRLAGDAARVLGLPEDAVRQVARAALVHDFGLTAVPNSVLDKAGPLTRAEMDRVRLHPAFTERMLDRTEGLQLLNPIAAAHHERADGSGYHKGLRAQACHPHAGILAAADTYVGLTTERADRPAHSEARAAAELRGLVESGRLPAAAVNAVLDAAGHGEAAAIRVPAGRPPAGLTQREVEVLRLVTRGLTTKQIADRLTITAKTTDHHIQHVYTKIGVSTRAAAALWAIQHELGPAEDRA